ncbi:two-component system, chemotaxis family, response regulator CheY [Reichenbachiella faecimaris]|uniref:Two-component system, chemotaxis family, response regulator CheY n=1 Tax=Reichenbachiella faecimaris TaxID=692418 RepID=A0A1W2GB99_REIFA|nr:response regulator [Reichenbachiella faecimaris]SMD33881.1 two-component system, chemotaxis family, response regulator CheY [Reichenbachiella faecimaris]
MTTVLVVDDSKFQRETIKNILEEGGYEVIGEAANGEDAIKLALILKPEIITLDNVLPDMFGLDVMDELNDVDFKAKVIMISAVGQDIAQREAKEIGILEYIVKPFEKQDLLDKVLKLATM